MKSQQAQVAALCKKYIKGLGIRCDAKSDSFSMGDSVDVNIYDQPPGVAKEIEQHLSMYMYGHFDGMTDMYECSNRNKDIPQTKFLTINNKHSQELKQAAYAHLRANLHGGEKLPESYEDGQAWGNELSGEHVPTMVHRLLTGALNGVSVDFWESRKPKAPEPVEIGAAHIEEHTHTKKGFQMFIVIIPRVERGEYDRLLSLCRDAGGWYSRKWGTTPGGFAFKSLEAARGFAGGTITATPTNQETEPKGNKHLADKLREAADKLQDPIDDKFRDRQDNTPKRLAQANHARLDGQKLERTQKVLRALADRHESGEVPAVLLGIKSKSDVFNLMASKTSPVNNGYHMYHVETGKPHYETPEALALWSLLEKPTPEQEQAEKLRRMVQGLQFSNIPGYFPTTPDVLSLMIDHADIQPTDRVLDPELGSGAIADAVKPLCSDVKGFEVNHTLAEICEIKDYLIDRRDFLTVQVEEITQYEKVLMNPPFENGQDIDHVMHAFQFLKSGGRLVSVMSSGTFSNSLSKASKFRAWLSEKGGEIYDIPEGAFKESGTMVSTKLVVIAT